MALSKHAQQFQDVLDQRGLGLRVVELPASTRTAAEAARALGCRPGQIVKSLLFRATATGKPVMVLASGTNWVDEQRISALLGGEIGKADAEFVRNTTGYATGTRWPCSSMKTSWPSTRSGPPPAQRVRCSRSPLRSPPADQPLSPSDPWPPTGLAGNP